MLGKNNMHAKVTQGKQLINSKWIRKVNREILGKK